MKIGLLREKYRMAQALPAGDPDRVYAQVVLGDALIHTNPDEAVKLLRKAVKGTARMVGSTNHPAVYVARMFSLITRFYGIIFI